MKIDKIARTVKRQIRAQEFSRGNAVQAVLAHPDHGFRRAARYHSDEYRLCQFSAVAVWAFMC